MFKKLNSRWHYFMDADTGAPGGGDADHPTDPSADPPSDPPTDPAQRPENVPEKFWNKEEGIIRHDDLLKSYGELENRMHPKEEHAFFETLEFQDGNLVTGEGFDNLPPVSSEDPVLTAMVSAAAEEGIPPEAFKNILMKVLRSSSDTLKEQQARNQQSEAHQLAVIGENATAVIQNVDVWLNANSSLEETETKALLEATSGNGLAIRALNKIRESLNTGPTIPMALQPGESQMTEAEIHERQNNDLSHAETPEGKAYQVETSRMWRELSVRNKRDESDLTPGRFDFDINE